MIIIYTQELEKAINMAKYLGSIELPKKLYRGNEIDDNIKEIKEVASEMHYFKTYIGQRQSMFLWGTGLVRALRKDEYEGYNPDEPFIPDKLYFKPTDGNEEHANLIKTTFSLEGHEEIYDASLGTQGQLSFVSLYLFSESNKRVRRIIIKEFSERGVQNAFINPMREDDTRKLMLKDQAYQLSHYIANLNLGKILNDKFPGYAVKMLELPIVFSVYERNRLIENELSKVNYTLSLKARTDLGGEFILKSRNAKFRNNDEREKFVKKIPKRIRITLSEKEEKEKSPGPHSVSSLEKASQSEFKYTPMKTSIILSNLFSSGYIKNYTSQSRKYALGSENEISNVLSYLGKTNAFSKYLNDDIKIPNEFFGNNNQSGIVVTSKRPNDSCFTDPASRNIYYLIAKEMVKTAMGPKVSIKKTATIEINGILFSCSDKTIKEPGYSMLDIKKPSSNCIPSSLSDNEIVNIEPVYDKTLANIPHQFYETELAELFTKGNGSLTLKLDYFTRMLESLIKRNILIRKGKSVLVSPEAVKIIDYLKMFEDLLLSPSSWQSTLERIASESTDIDTSENLANNLLIDVRAKVNLWIKNLKDIEGAKSDIECSICSAKLYKTSEKLQCLNCGFEINRTQYGRMMKDEELKFLLEKKTTMLLPGFNINNNRLTGRLYFTSTGGLKFTEDSLYDCPSCHTKLRLKDSEYYCHYCDFKIRTVCYGHELKHNEMRELLTSLRTPKIDDLRDDDRQFNGLFYLDRDDSYQIKCIAIRDD